MESLLEILVPIFAAIAGAMAGRATFPSLSFPRRRLPNNFVIVINGANSVGKSTYALMLQRRFSNIEKVSLDWIRQGMRDNDSESVINTASFNPLPKMGVQEHFIKQCQILMSAVSNVVNRLNYRKSAIVIDGVNLIPSLFPRARFTSGSKFIFITLYIENFNPHVQRIESRENQDIERLLNKIDRIREVQNLIVQDYQRLEASLEI